MSAQIPCDHNESILVKLNIHPCNKSFYYIRERDLHEDYTDLVNSVRSYVMELCNATKALVEKVGKKGSLQYRVSY